MILLDTNALIWLDLGHRRCRPLSRWSGRLFVSPATLLELQMLEEVGRGRARTSIGQVANDDRWVIDDPGSADWFAAALDLSWTRDPFDRLIAAHARLRGWRLATGDEQLIERLGAAALPL